MFNSFFTTYQMVEPPPIIKKETESIQNAYRDFLKVNYPTYNNYPSSIELEPQNDPLASTTDAPVIFNMNRVVDTNDTPTKLVQPRYSQGDQREVQTTTLPAFESRGHYAKTMYSHLYKALQNNGIDADVWTPTLVAHTSIESGWGNKFSRDNNNFGGIKGKGSKVVSTKEWSPSKGYYTIKDTFKAYPSVQAFADDYVKKLKNRFKAFEGTPQEYLKNIRKHGYFTASLSDYQRMFDSRLNKIHQLLNS